MRTHTGILILLLSIPLLLSGAGSSRAEIVAAGIVLAEGELLGSSAVTALSAPFTDGEGRAGFVATLADGQRVIWWDEGAVFFSDDALPDVLVGGESTMGIGDGGEFIYSPSFNGFDAVYTHGGKLLAEEDPCPPLPGLFSTFNSRPTMRPDGTAYWIGGTADVQGGNTSNRHLFTAPDPTDPGSIVRILGGGDLIEGKVVDPDESNFSYWISDNGLHHIHILMMVAAQSEHVYLDGGFVAQEGGPAGDGFAWQDFDIVAVNDTGSYLFTGDTDGPATGDECLVYNGEIAVREGDTLDGVLLASGFAVRAASLNDLDQVAHAWGAGSNEILFVGEGVDLQSSRRILATGDGIDIDNDEQAEYTVVDFKASAVVGPGLDFAEDGAVLLEVDLVPVSGGDEVEAILRIPVDGTAALEEAPMETRAILRALHNPSQRSVELKLAATPRGVEFLGIFDAAGRRIRLLHDGEGKVRPGRILWDGRDDEGTDVPSGVYFVRAAGPAVEQTMRITLLR